ncbi:MAG: SAM-dependent methyltransferase [Oscillospiraceae bacterium]|nr:SAM-dependent methyltransferase [Oscillospiraceae bacterium]
MAQITLPKRLAAISQLVEKDALVADIGTDHALLPISLVESCICERVIASDIAIGPLKSASKNITAHNLGDKIKTVLSDGLENVTEFEPQNIIIAGMGGETIRDILAASVYPKAYNPLLILQPMTHSELLRRFLIESGYSILGETVVREQHRFYVIITARFLSEQKHYFKNDSAVFELGGITSETSECGGEYLLWQKGVFEKNLTQIEKSAPSDDKDRLLEYFSALIKETERRMTQNT